MPELLILTAKEVEKLLLTNGFEAIVKNDIKIFIRAILPHFAKISPNPFAIEKAKEVLPTQLFY